MGNFGKMFVSLKYFDVSNLVRILVKKYCFTDDSVNVQVMQVNHYFVIGIRHLK